jgi:hypothetical protein
MSLSAPVVRNPRFNLKISPTLRSRFEEPYDAFLGFLLEISRDQPSFDRFQFELKDSKAPQGQNRWTVWVSRDIRDRFNQRKAVLASTKTHGN